MHTAKSLKAKKLIFYFQTTKKTSKKKTKCFSLYFLALITSLLKLRELGQYFKKIILFSFNIQDYEFTCKMYSRY